MKVVLAKQAGYCFGVRRAVELTEKTLKGNATSLKKVQGSVFSLGALIHNPQAVARLEKKGLRIINSVKKAPEGSQLIIRSHGAPQEAVEAAREKGVRIIDATCPFVKNAQAAAKKFYQEGRQVVILGDAQHAEVIGINSRTEYTAIVLASVEEANKIDFSQKKIGLVCQTTQKIENLKKLVAVLTEKTKDLAIQNTICNDCSLKQEEVRKMARKFKAIVVVGGKQSSNTTKLFQIAQAEGAEAYHIEEANEIKKSWFRDKAAVGVVAGASTPDFSIEAVVRKLEVF